MKFSVEQFAKALAASHLMSGPELNAFWGAIPSGERPKDADAFAERLVKAGKLTPFQAAEILAGRGENLVMGDYAVLAEIGAGGMGKVYKARHRTMERTVALKVMSAAAMQDEAAVKRFQREVRAAARLEHANIVTAYDSGTAGNVKYLVMQFVDGGDLSALVKKNGPLPIEKAIDYVLQAARGLAFAHAEGVIHRDIKPANLLVDKKGTVKILDMGLARIEQADDGLTATEQVMGTVDYMSPEQAAHTKGADARADIYSLGCTLWYLLTGRKTYDGETLVARIMAHRDAPLPSLSPARADAPASLEPVLHRMIAKRPEDRYQTMNEVVAALEPSAQAAAGTVGARSSAGGRLAAGGDDAPTNPEMAAFLKTASYQSGGAAPGVTAAVANVATASAKQASLKSAAATARRAPPRSKGVGFKWYAAGLAGIVATAVAGWFALRRPDSESSATRAPGTSSASVPEQGGGAGPMATSGAGVTSVAMTALASPTAVGSALPTALGPPPPHYALDLSARLPVGAAHVTLPITIRQNEPLTIELTAVPRTADADSKPMGIWHAQTHIELIQVGEYWAFGVNAPKPLTTFRAVSTAKVVPGRPVHLAGVWTGREMRLFVDGKQAAPTTAGPKPVDAPVPVMIGYGPVPLSVMNYVPFDGTVDEIRISKSARYDADYVPAERLASDGETLALYHADEGRGDKIADSSGNHHDGTLVGAKWAKVDATAPPFSPLGLASSGAMPASAAGTASTDAGPRLEFIASLSVAKQDDAYPWILQGGRICYFTRETETGESSIFRAERAGGDADFSPPVRVLAARQMAVSDDETYAVMLPAGDSANAQFEERSRLSVHEPWSPPRPIGSLAPEIGVKSPWLSGDGLTLVYQRQRSAAQYAGKVAEFAICRRPKRGQPWGPPTLLPMAPDPRVDDVPTWPCLSADGLRLAFCNGGTRNPTIMLADRAAPDTPFGNYRPVLVDGRPLTGRSPRWSTERGTLYFSRDADPAVKDSGIFMVKGVDAEGRP